jgi:hypothetical protein
VRLRVCDDAPQFKWLTEDIGLCWVHEGRHYKKLATHRGQFMGLPPMGKSFAIAVVDICRFENGKIVEHWGVPDRFHLMAQLGALPRPPRRTA